MLKVDGGPTIQTYSGLQVHLLDPRPDEISLRDIAHATALQCRFTGHTRYHYSVAQHSIYVSRVVPAHLALEGLLHDAQEAYLCDMARPLKHFTKMGEEYLKIEEKFEAVIREKFGLPQHMSPEVKTADNSLLYLEKEELLPPSEWSHDWGTQDPDSVLGIRIYPWTPDIAEGRFLDRFAEIEMKIKKGPQTRGPDWVMLESRH